MSETQRISEGPGKYMIKTFDTPVYPTNVQGMFKKPVLGSSIYLMNVESDLKGLGSKLVKEVKNEKRRLPEKLKVCTCSDNSLMSIETRTKRACNSVLFPSQMTPVGFAQKTNGNLFTVNTRI